MATPKEQRDARAHAMNTGSVRRGPSEPGQQGRAATPGTSAEPTFDASPSSGREGAREDSRQDSRRGADSQSRPADPDVPSSDEP